jgi:predicted nucleotidyltransferase
MGLTVIEAAQYKTRLDHLAVIQTSSEGELLARLLFTNSAGGGLFYSVKKELPSVGLRAVNEALLRQLAAKVREEIPEAEVRLFGCQARGEARPDSDSALLITVTDNWLRHHSRFEVIDRLRWRLSEPSRPVDLRLFSRSQVEQLRQSRSSVVDQAYTDGLCLDG